MCISELVIEIKAGSIRMADSAYNLNYIFVFNLTWPRNIQAIAYKLSTGEVPIV